MKVFPENLLKKLEERKAVDALRNLSGSCEERIDFSSNDYLGIAGNEEIYEQAHRLLSEIDYKKNGATGSRLLTGNHILYDEAEEFIARFHGAESALIFNSGYDANIGLLGSVLERNDIVLFDELSHASICEGIRLSDSKSYKYRHNDLEDLENLLSKFYSHEEQVYVVTESVFSMDGDMSDMEKLCDLTERYNALLIVDEAHAVGVFGSKGEGIIHKMNLCDKIFARVITFGKALGCHGAAVLGTTTLKNYLVNFAGSFIYTTGLSPHSVATILVAYNYLDISNEPRFKLHKNIRLFKENIPENIEYIPSNSAIQSVVIPGNEQVKKVATHLQQSGFDVKPILSPTAPVGKERLRFCIHAYNTEEEILKVLKVLKLLQSLL